jgi:vacuolar iron transporter family protein
MMMEEHGYSQTEHEPFRSAAATFIAFLVVGFVPLFAFVVELIWPSVIAEPFAWSAVMTAVAFFFVGALKSRFVGQRWWLSGLETLGVGGAAAILAFVVGTLLKNVS